LGKINKVPDENYDTVIGTKSSFEGNIECESSIKVNGKVKGDIKVDGDVMIGSSGFVAGNIIAVNTYLSGTVEGNINCSGVLKLLKSSRLYGDIEVANFIADEGSIFHGKCNMVDKTLSESSNKKKSIAAKDYKKSGAIEEAAEPESDKKQKK
jgi:cytoskeletal protein CcmA (bactofilin family)